MLAVVEGIGLPVTFGQVPDQSWEAPPAARARENPISSSPEVLEQGRELYQKNCLTCHGPTGRGDGPAAPFIDRRPADLSSPALQQRLTDGEIFWKVTEGRKPMPTFRRKLTEEERWKLVHYVRSLRAG